MAYNNRRLENHSGSGAGRKLWSYNAGDDNAATVAGAGYFNDAALILTAGDRIFVHADDADFTTVVQSVEDGVVTVGAEDDHPA